MKGEGQKERMKEGTTLDGRGGRWDRFFCHFRTSTMEEENPNTQILRPCKKDKAPEREPTRGDPSQLSRSERPPTGTGSMSVTTLSGFFSPGVGVPLPSRTPRRSHPGGTTYFSLRYTSFDKKGIEEERGGSVHVSVGELFRTITT